MFYSISSYTQSSQLCNLENSKGLAQKVKFTKTEHISVEYQNFANSMISLFRLYSCSEMVFRFPRYWIVFSRSLMSRKLTVKWWLNIVGGKLWLMWPERGCSRMKWVKMARKSDRQQQSRNRCSETFVEAWVQIPPLLPSNVIWFFKVRLYCNNVFVWESNTSLWTWPEVNDLGTVYQNAYTSDSCTVKWNNYITDTQTDIA